MSSGRLNESVGDDSGKEALLRVREACRLRRIPEKSLRDAIRRREVRTAALRGWTRVRLRDVDDWLDAIVDPPCPIEGVLTSARQLIKREISRTDATRTSLNTTLNEALTALDRALLEVGGREQR